MLPSSSSSSSLSLWHRLCFLIRRAQRRCTSGHHRDDAITQNQTRSRGGKRKACIIGVMLAMMLCALYVSRRAPSDASAADADKQTLQLNTDASVNALSAAAVAADRASADHAAALAQLQQQVEEMDQLKRKIAELEAANAQATAEVANAAAAAAAAAARGETNKAVETAEAASPAASVAQPALRSSSFSPSFSSARCELLGGATGSADAADPSSSSSTARPSTLHCHTDPHGHWLASWSAAESSGVVSGSLLGGSSFRSSAPLWVWYRPLRLLVSAWERAQFDWHLLIPPAQLGDSGELALDRLIAKERAVMELLLTARTTMQFGPGDAPAFNPDLQFCPQIADKCVMHRDERECIADGFCVWAPSPLLLCVSRRRLNPDGLDAPPESLSAQIWPGHVFEPDGSQPTNVDRPTPGAGGVWKLNPQRMPEILWPSEMQEADAATETTADPAAVPVAAGVAEQSADPSVPAAAASASPGVPPVLLPPPPPPPPTGVASSMLPSQLSGFLSFSFVSVLSPPLPHTALSVPTLRSHGAADSKAWPGVPGGWGWRHERERMHKSDCDVFIRGDSFVLDMGNNAGMFWHFLTEQLSGLLPLLLSARLVSDPSSVHFFFRKPNGRGEFDTLWQWFNVHSLNCGMHVQDLMAHGKVCFERLHIQQPASLSSQIASLKSFTTHALQRTGLADAWSENGGGQMPFAQPTRDAPLPAPPAAASSASSASADSTPASSSSSPPPAAAAPPSLLTVGFVSRQDKRILLNEGELCTALASSSPAAHSLRIAYDHLPIHLQLAATRQSDVLTGLHGSGLLNTVFMRRGTGELQIVPPGLWAEKSYVQCYVDAASNAGVHYAELDVSGEHRGVKHWHFAGSKGTTLEYKMSLGAQGTKAVSSGMARIMFIQQDARVEPQSFLEKIEQLRTKMMQTRTKGG